MNLSLTDAEFAAKNFSAFEIGMFKDVVSEHGSCEGHDTTEFGCRVAQTYRVALAAHEARGSRAIADNEIEKAPEARRTYGNSNGNSNGGRSVRMATEPQVQYVKNLMAARVVTETERKTWTTMLEVGLTFDQASSIITRLKTRAFSAQAEKAKATRMATDNQKRYITDLLGTKVWDKEVDVDALTFEEASTLLDALKEAPRKPRNQVAKVGDGIYVYEGQYVKVLVAIYGSGRRYTKVFNTETEEWERKGNLLGKLRPEHKLTEEQASRFAIYGRCVSCNRPLTDELSIARGMGKDCFANAGF